MELLRAARTQPAPPHDESCGRNAPRRRPVGTARSRRVQAIHAVQARRVATRGLLLALLSLVGPFLAGCNTARFYVQAVHGQAQMLHRQKSIAKLLDRADTAPELAARLRLALAIRTFAEHELGLPANGHYLTYADLGRRFAVWNVYAAPEFSLEAKAWWYPIVGRLKYQGYFNEASARRLGARLALRGYDAYIGGVQAYSTLGWFRDPVLNTFAFDPDVDLAELLFHELAHQRLFVAGDTDFNEAFATAVAEEGVRRWLLSRGNPEAQRAYDEEQGRKEQFIALLAGARDRLAALYASPSALSDPRAPGTGQDHPTLRAEKAAIFSRLQDDYATLKRSWGGQSDYDPWFKQPLNNARLNTVETYYRLRPAFRRLLAASDGNLARFYTETERLKQLDPEARRARMETLARENGENQSDQPAPEP